MGPRWWILGAVVLMAVGCADEAATKADLDAYCDAYCGWRERCQNPRSDCRPGCQQEAGGAYTNYKAAFFKGMTECYTTHECGKSADACFTEAAQKIAPDWASDPDFRRCNEVRQSCAAAEKPSFSDDYCGSVLVLTGAGTSAFLACLERPCEEMRDCLKGVVG